MTNDDVLQSLLSHPMVVSAEDLGSPGLIRVQFSNGKTGDLDRTLVEQRPVESEAEYRDRVFQGLLDLAAYSPVEDIDVGQAVPLVRSADYFMSEAISPSFLWRPLTDFVGMGLAIDLPAQVRIVSGDELPVDRSSDGVECVRRQACENLRQRATGNLLNNLDFGPDVLAVATPEHFETSWFANLEICADMLSHLEQQTGTRWVVIPKSRRDLLVVNSMTAAWGPLVDWMELFLEDRETVHLAPHVLDDGRWREFVPQIQPEAAQRIRLLALRSQGRIQANTLSVLRAGESKGIDFVAPFGTYENDGEFITYAAVSLDLDATSVPRVERVEFVVGEKEIHEIFFEHLVARLSHLIRPHPGSYPPRWIVSKPSDADLKLIGELAI